MRFEKYVRPDNLSTALDLLQADKDAVILGGNTFLRLSKIKYSTALDLSELGIDFIEEKKDVIEIGAYTSFRTIETNKVIKKYFDNLIVKSLENIIGVQFRNNATIGGSIMSRLGFSEILTALLVLDCDLEFAESGKIKLSEHLSKRKIRNDILKKIIIKKTKSKNSYQMIRKANSDFSILSVAVSRSNGLKIAVGTRPYVAKLSNSVKDLESINQDNVEKISAEIAEEFDYGDDLRAKSEYRKAIAPVLIKRALLEVL